LTPGQILLYLTYWFPQNQRAEIVAPRAESR
jgi:hypothetical protein